MGCFKKGCGCLAGFALLFVGVLIAAGLLSGREARTARSRIHVGMTVQESVDAAGRWTFASAYAGPPDKRLASFTVFPTSYGPVGSVARRFDSPRQMVEALAAEMKTLGSPWKITFGYVTMAPRRLYFDVEYSPDGKVLSISPTRWGTLD